MAPAAIIEERVRFSARPCPGEAGGALTGVLGYPADGEPTRAVLLCSPHPHFAGDMDNNVVRAVARGLAADSVTLRFDYRGVGDSEIALPEGLSVFDYWGEVERARDFRDALADIAAACAELTRITDGLPLFVVGYSFGAAAGLMFALAHPATRAMVGVSPPLARVDFGFLAAGRKHDTKLIPVGHPERSDCRPERSDCHPERSEGSRQGPGAEIPSPCSGQVLRFAQNDKAARRDRPQKPCLLLCGKNDFVYSAAEAARLAGASGAGAGLVVEQLDGSDHFFRGEEEGVCRRVRKFLTEGK